MKKRILKLLMCILSISMLSGCSVINDLLGLANDENEDNGQGEPQDQDLPFNGNGKAKLDFDASEEKDVTLKQYTFGWTDPSAESMYLNSMSFNEAICLIPNHTNNGVDFYSNTLESSTKKIAEPSKTITSTEDLAKCMDYCAFYHIEDLTVNVSDDLKNEDFEALANQAFWDATLMSGTVNFDLSFNRYKKPTEMKFKFLFSNMANRYYIYGNSNIIPEEPLVTGTNKKYTTQDIGSNFEYDRLSAGKTEVEVYNSEQLFYAFQNGYYPICLNNSPAQTLVNKCETILSDIIYEGMSEQEKLYNIYAYINGSTEYDGNQDWLLSMYNDKVNHPDELASCFCSMYAEGPILYGKGVCHGFAKAFAILAAIEGIQTYKVSNLDKDCDKTKTISAVVETVENDYIVNTVYYTHGYLYYKNAFGKYGIIDPTYASNGYMNTLSAHRINISKIFALDMSRDVWEITYSNMPDDAFYNKHKKEMHKYSYGICAGNTIPSIVIGDRNVDLMFDDYDDFQYTIQHLQSFINALPKFQNKVFESNYEVIMLQFSVSNEFVLYVMNNVDECCTALDSIDVTLEYCIPRLRTNMNTEYLPYTFETFGFSIYVHPNN